MAGREARAYRLENLLDPKERQVNIVQAIEDPNLFRPYVTGDADGDLGSWANWLTFLHVLYGLPVAEADHEIIRQCTGRDPMRLSQQDYQEALLLCGRRTASPRLSLWWAQRRPC